jgi:hypothetical protein
MVNYSASVKRAPRTGTASPLSGFEAFHVRGVRFTPEADVHGLALALRAGVKVPSVPNWAGTARFNYALARPTGVERADARNIRIPIAGASASWPSSPLGCGGPRQKPA